MKHGINNIFGQTPGQLQWEIVMLFQKGVHYKQLILKSSPVARGSWASLPQQGPAGAVNRTEGRRLCAFADLPLFTADRGKEREYHSSGVSMKEMT